MEYTEYMETLKEQIQNKRARSLVAEEIRGHIEEQAKEYQAEGMSKEDAEREAVRQMGDPVETGCALNLSLIHIQMCIRDRPSNMDELEEAIECMCANLNLAHFSRVFKKQVGVSANEYRNQVLGKQIKKYYNQKEI